uniref:Glutamate receptor n=1 Tax=Oryza brachyantha TaxID=4533 RepID=J3MXN7_ORYBR
MEKAPRAIVVLLLLRLLAHFGAVALNVSTNPGADEFHVGVILDMGSLVGKEARTSISLAAEDFYAVHRNYSTRLVLHVRDSMGNSFQAASAALDLLNNYNVKAIIGPQKSSEAFFMKDIANISEVPVISFTATSPSLTYDNIPYFVRATISDSTQVNSIASLIKFYGWREVVPIYIDTDYGTGIMLDLLEALQGNDARVPYQSIIHQSATRDQMTQELYKLMTMQTRVFVVHMTSSMASVLFTMAKEVGMMNKGYVWIITFGVASLIGSLNPSVLEAMNGALGVEVYVPKSTELENFTIRWNTRFRKDNPNDPLLKLSIFGLWGYDTIWAVAHAAEMARPTKDKVQMHHMSNSTTTLKGPGNTQNGMNFLDAIFQYKFWGLSGYFDLSERQLQPTRFKIINIVGKGWRDIGFWTAKDGFSQRLTKPRSNRTYLGTKPYLNPVIWPGESTNIPRGWEIPTSGKKLQVGVCTSGGYPEYIYAEKDPIITGITTASGLVVDVFEETVKRLPYALPYEYVFYNTTENISSSYDDFVYQVYLKKYDIAIADITITYKRSSYVDFSLPYTESGVAMIVPVKKNINTTTWIFLKPLTFEMWFGSIMLFIYTGVVVWLLEFLSNNKNFCGPIPKHMVMIYFSLFAKKEMVERPLSRIVLIIWLFFLLVLTSSYTASLTSMLTVQQLQPTVTDVHELLRNGEYVGYQRGSYVKDLLDELGFSKSKIRRYDNIDEFRDALSKGSSNGGISALVDEIPYIKLFLAKHCEGYTMVGPIYKTAGFGYAFQKESPLRGDISKAILNITGGDTIIQIEKKWIGDQNKCRNVGPVTISGSLTFESFKGLFILTGVASTSSLLIALAIYFYKNKQVKSGNGEQNFEQKVKGDTIEASFIIQFTQLSGLSPGCIARNAFCSIFWNTADFA